MTRTRVSLRALYQCATGKQYGHRWIKRCAALAAVQCCHPMMVKTTDGTASEKTESEETVITGKKYSSRNHELPAGFDNAWPRPRGFARGASGARCQRNPDRRRKPGRLKAKFRDTGYQKS